MIIYNVTVKVLPEIEEDWLDWMQRKHIADVMNSGFFERYELVRVFTEEETDGITFAIKYYCESLDKLESYQQQFALELQKEHTERYKDKFVAFRTIMELINH